MIITDDQKERILAQLTGGSPDTFFPKLIEKYILPRLEALEITPEEFKSGQSVINESTVTLEFMVELHEIMNPHLSKGEILASLDAQELLQCRELVRMTTENIILSVALDNAQKIFAEGEARSLDDDLRKLLEEQ